MDLNQFLTNDETRTMHMENGVQNESQYNSQETFQLGEPIILEEADMLFRHVINNYNFILSYNMQNL